MMKVNVNIKVMIINVKCTIGVGMRCIEIMVECLAVAGSKRFGLHGLVVAESSGLAEVDILGIA